MENLIPGAEQKINEYVERIQNGEDKEWVLQGIGPAFRTPVEERLGNTQEKELTDAEKIAQLEQELGIKRAPVEIERSEISEKEVEALEQALVQQEELPSQQEKVLSPEKIQEYKKLSGWVASYELAKVAKSEGIDLSTLSREQYVDYAIDHYLAIDDDQLRMPPWQRMSESVDEAIKANREHKSSISEENEKAFAQFSHEMMELAKKDQQERYIAEGVRVLSGTKDSNSWLFFSINEGTDTKNPDTFKSYLSLKDLNAFSSEQYKQYMETLQKRGYNGGVKIFQDLTEQGSVLNDQVVMHGFSEADAALALEVASEVFSENIEHTSLGKDEYNNGVSKSYSQVLAEKIKEEIKQKT
ncbi:hypothetical protein K2Q02_00545 [Patescibacteria group bacterium]|nr:hypothetical protein [Patescibacteria group bacterium]